MNKEKIHIRPFEISDAQSLAENADNINVWNCLRDSFPHPYSEKDAEDFIKTNLKNPKLVNLAIIVGGKAVGSIGIALKADVERIAAECGYFIGEKYWNKGIMTVVLKDFVEYVFENFPEIQKIFALPFGFNTASQKVLEKAGFVCEAVLKTAAVKNGQITEQHYFSIFRN